MDTQQTNIKTAFEIGSLAGQLTRKNQSYVLNTINALLFSQQTNERDDEYIKKG
ncbi:MAG: Superfamily II DNA and RNA helicase [uncultured Clostridium sp.]